MQGSLSNGDGLRPRSRHRKQVVQIAHAAKIENGIVTQVIVVPNDLDETESDAAITAYCNQIGLPGRWVRTSYNSADNGFRGKYAGLGDKYDAELDEFVSPVVEGASAR